jgi:hypothetical protein
MAWRGVITHECGALIGKVIIFLLHQSTYWHRKRNENKKWGIAEATVHVHVKHLLKKLGSHTRAEAVLKALRHFWLRGQS